MLYLVLETGIGNSDASAILDAIASTFDLFLRLFPSDEAWAPGNNKLLGKPIELLLLIGELQASWPGIGVP